MRSTDDVVAYLITRIGYVYHHSGALVYGGTAEGVNLLLRTYHEIWSVCTNREQDLAETLSAAKDAANCGAATFAGRYAMNHPEASEEEVARYAMDRFREVSDQLGMPIPHEELEREFRRR